VDLDPAARELIDSGRLAHLVTVGPDGLPQISCIWVGLDGDEIVSGHLAGGQAKLRNVRADPRVALSIESPERNEIGLQRYLVVHGTARVQEGGAPELLQRLAYRYIGPDVVFPAMTDPPPGHVLRITVERVGGVGPWASWG
jgi:PPOX class probable F420-dependent enzyme